MRRDKKFKKMIQGRRVKRVPEECGKAIYPQSRVESRIDVLDAEGRYQEALIRPT